jgi:CelD/BcsL family acetyltransferase involved in cellulose biosynthesis
VTVPHVDVVSLAEVPQKDIAAWRLHHASRSNVVGVCESPDFLLPISQVLGNCRAIRLRDGSETIGYIPIYQPMGPTLAFPIPMCDYQAVAIFEPTTYDLRSIVRRAGIYRWKYENITEFNGLDLISRRFDRGYAPIVKVTGEPARYYSERADSGVTFETIRRQERKLSRKVGKVLLNRVEADEAFIDHLLECKRYRQPDMRPFEKYVGEVLLKFSQSRNAAIAGVGYVLKAGEEDVAFGFTLENGRHAFGWFCGYDPRFAKYSPGSMLILKLIEEMHLRGFESFDLGPGGEPWKERFANWHRPVGIGYIYSYDSIGQIEDGVRRIGRSMRHAFRLSGA